MSSNYQNNEDIKDNIYYISQQLKNKKTLFKLKYADKKFFLFVCESIAIFQHIGNEIDFYLLDYRTKFYTSVCVYFMK